MSESKKTQMLSEMSCGFHQSLDPDHAAIASQIAGDVAGNYEIDDKIQPIEYEENYDVIKVFFNTCRFSRLRCLHQTFHRTRLLRQVPFIQTQQTMWRLCIHLASEPLSHSR